MADNQEEINCPACGMKMKKVYMPTQGINLDVCVDGCGGIYFDNREFAKFDENAEDIEPLVHVLEGKEFKKVDESERRICPVCGMKMVKNFASAKHEVQVDECYGCGGKFLDNDELIKIRSQYNTEEERVADVLNELYLKVGMELSLHEEKYQKAVGKQGLFERYVNRKRF